MDKTLVEIENVSDGVKIDIKHFEKIENGYGGVMDLNIPEHSSQSSISVFATIYELKSDGSSGFGLITAFEIHSEDFNYVEKILHYQRNAINR